MAAPGSKASRKPSRPAPRKKGAGMKAPAVRMPTPSGASGRAASASALNGSSMSPSSSTLNVPKALTEEERRVLLSIANHVPNLAELLKKSKVQNEAEKIANIRKRSSDILAQESDETGGVHGKKKSRQDGDDDEASNILDDEEQDIALTFKHRGKKNGRAIILDDSDEEGDVSDAQAGYECNDDVGAVGADFAEGEGDDAEKAENREEDGVTVIGDDSVIGVNKELIKEAEFVIEEEAEHAIAKRCRGRKPNPTLGTLDVGPVRDLADQGHKIIQSLICADHAFPLQRKRTVDKALSEAASWSPQTTTLWAKLCSDPLLAEQRSHVADYVWKGAASVCGHVKDKVHGVVGLYQVPGGLGPGNIEAIKGRVAWLIEEKKFRFTFGGLNVESKTFDALQPLGHPALETIIQSQWFASSKSDGARYPARFRNIPAPVWALAMTALEAALADWQMGQYSRVKFAEERWRKSYKTNLAYVNSIMKNSPTWYQNFSREVYDRVCYNGNIAVEFEDDEELDGIVNFDALEALAVGPISLNATNTPISNVASAGGPLDSAGGGSGVGVGGRSIGGLEGTGSDDAAQG
ncbi:hypothetical protein OE88DRAFT_1733394 [Heliocybe sulcata]|uniref:DUF6532 domain-containing protein n=1 Tax=Heliocybe sulcata TaxID=5364 RepID=A0A5C3N700_9AGAM|nr:hypothetical protein OE88DRAFT_1733394 [Heliocybe sulcata]